MPARARRTARRSWALGWRSRRDGRGACCARHPRRVRQRARRGHVSAQDRRAARRSGRSSSAFLGLGVTFRQDGRGACCARHPRLVRQRARRPVRPRARRGHVPAHHLRAARRSGRSPVGSRGGHMDCHVRWRARTDGRARGFRDIDWDGGRSAPAAAARKTPLRRGRCACRRAHRGARAVPPSAARRGAGGKLAERPDQAFAARRLPVRPHGAWDARVVGQSVNGARFVVQHDLRSRITADTVPRQAAPSRAFGPQPVIGRAPNRLRMWERWPSPTER